MNAWLGFQKVRCFLWLFCAGGENTMEGWAGQPCRWWGLEEDQKRTWGQHLDKT